MKVNKILLYCALMGILTFTIPGFANDTNVLSDSEKYSISGYPLSLDEVIRYTLQNNFDIEIARLERKIIAHEIPAQEAVYDINLTSDFEYTVDQAERASSILAQKANTTVWNIGLEKKFQSGTTVALDFLNTRNSAPSTFSSLNPYYMSDLQIGLTQPILKNSFGFLDRASVKLVKLDVSRLDLNLLNTIESDISDVMRAYWDLFFAYGNLNAKEEALEFAEEFLKITDEQFANGALEETDLYAAKANVERRKKEVLEAKNVISNTSDDLKLAMNFFPEFELYPSEKPDISFEELGNGKNVFIALDNRRDLEAAHIQIESQKLSLKMKKNSIWPQLDLLATFTSNGLDRKMIDALGEAAGFDDNTYFIGATFSVPLENRRAKSRFSQTELEKAKSIWEVKRIEKEIETDISKDLRALTLTQNQIAHNEKKR